MCYKTDYGIPVLKKTDTIGSNFRKYVNYSLHLEIVWQRIGQKHS